MRKLSTQLWEQRPTVLGCPDLISLPFVSLFLFQLYFTISFRVLRIVGKMFSEFLFSWYIARYWGRNSLAVNVSGILESPSEGFPRLIGRCYKLRHSKMPPDNAAGTPYLSRKTSLGVGQMASFISWPKISTHHCLYSTGVWDLTVMEEGGRTGKEWFSICRLRP